MIHHKLPPAPTLTYGEHPDQVANLHLPAADGGPWPCVVLLHGGFWRTGWDRTLMTPLAIGLAREGVAAWNVEYRRVGQAGGGWPGTLEDVAAAVDRLAEVEEIDADRVATCGHSAGGHLALWLAARHRLAGVQVGSAPRVRPLGAVALAGVCDLEQAWRDGLGRGAAEGLLGSLDAEPGRYAAASPRRSLLSACRNSSCTARRTTSSRSGRAAPIPISSRTPAWSRSRAPTTSTWSTRSTPGGRLPSSGSSADSAERAPPRSGRGPLERSAGQDFPPPARNCSQASLMRSAWPCVNMFMQESCV